MVPHTATVGRVKVAVRCRPPFQHEIDFAKGMVSTIRPYGFYDIILSCLRYNPMASNTKSTTEGNFFPIVSCQAEQPAEGISNLFLNLHTCHDLTRISFVTQIQIIQISPALL